MTILFDRSGNMNINRKCNKNILLQNNKINVLTSLSDQSNYYCPSLRDRASDKNLKFESEEVKKQTKWLRTLLE
jgi:hypothetical protein